MELFFFLGGVPIKVASPLEPRDVGHLIGLCCAGALPEELKEGLHQGIEWGGSCHFVYLETAWALQATFCVKFNINPLCNFARDAAPKEFGAVGRRVLSYSGCCWQRAARSWTRV